MPLFLTLTPNPALDLSTRTERVAPTHKLRCGTVVRYPGGGGINVARVLHRLGASVQAWHLAGGPAGAQLQDLLVAEGLQAHCQPIAGDTRENLSVVETCSGHEYRFVLPGPTLQTHEWQGCLDQIAAQAAHATPPQWLVASGSLPPGVPSDFYARLARTARHQGRLFAIDSSGPALAAALQEGVHLVKPSLSELCELTHAPLPEPAQWRAAAQALVQQGQAGMVALSCGDQGAVLATPAGIWQAQALPVVAATGTTGAGDCFLAGLLAALARGESPPEALCWASAAGAAALLAPGTALAQASEVQRLRAQVVVQAY